MTFATHCYIVSGKMKSSDLVDHRHPMLMFLQMKEDLMRRLQRVQVQVVDTGSVSGGCGALGRLKVGTERERYWVVLMSK